jgi:DNA-binding transcriptional MerR regulator
MPYKEHSIEKKYYSIGEVATHFQVATSLIRFWETEFPSINPKKNKRGNRQFTKENIEQIKLVFHLVKEKGYTLQGAKDILIQQKSKAVSNLEAIESLKKVKAFLIDLKGNL